MADRLIQQPRSSARRLRPMPRDRPNSRPLLQPASLDGGRTVLIGLPVVLLVGAFMHFAGSVVRLLAHLAERGRHPALPTLPESLVYHEPPCTSFVRKRIGTRQPVVFDLCANCRARGSAVNSKIETCRGIGLREGVTPMGVQMKRTRR